MKEATINEVLLKRGIDTIDKLNVKDLSEAFGIRTFYQYSSTFIVKEKEQAYCVLNKGIEPYVQYEQFLHELAHHYLEHNRADTSQTRDWKYLETKANAIVPYFAIPQFALKDLDKYENLEEISQAFNISYQLTYKRLKSLEVIQHARLQRQKERYLVLSDIYKR